MGTLESKIEKILEPKKKIIVLINYSTDELETWLEINKKKFLVPAGSAKNDFVLEETRNYRGIVTCCVYVGIGNGGF